MIESMKSKIGHNPKVIVIVLRFKVGLDVTWYQIKCVWDLRVDDVVLLDEVCNSIDAVSYSIIVGETLC